MHKYWNRAFFLVSQRVGCTHVLGLPGSLCSVTAAASCSGQLRFVDCQRRCGVILMPVCCGSGNRCWSRRSPAACSRLTYPDCGWFSGSLSDCTRRTQASTLCVSVLKVPHFGICQHDASISSLVATCSNHAFSDREQNFLESIRAASAWMQR